MGLVSVKVEPYGGVLRQTNRGRWTYDSTVNGERKIVSTRTTNFDEAMLIAKRLATTHVIKGLDQGGAYPRDYDDLFKTSKKNAAARGKQFNLTRDEFDTLVKRANGHCELTGLRFQRIKDGARFERQPFLPSLDREDNSQGYSLSNCRLVCIAVNYALSTWGDWVLFEIAKALLTKNRGPMRSKLPR